MGYVFQNPEHQFVTDTVFGELAFSLSPKAGTKGRPPPDRSPARAGGEWLDRLGLLPLAEANPFSLSQGQKRRLSVAAMLIRGQSALILDEPTLGQDETQAARLHGHGRGLQAGGRHRRHDHPRHALIAESRRRSSWFWPAGGVVFAGEPADFFRRPDAGGSRGPGGAGARARRHGLLDRDDPGRLLDRGRRSLAATRGAPR